MPEQDPRSLGDLLAQLSRETGILVRKEVELATTEMSAKAREAAADAAVTAVGGALAHAGLLVLLAALVIGLTRLGVEAWLSALIVALVTIGVGYLFVNRGLARMRRINPMPAQTILTLKETATWKRRQRA